MNGRVFACAVLTSVVVLAAQSTEQLASETKRTTSAGATFTAPAAWSLRSEAQYDRAHAAGTGLASGDCRRESCGCGGGRARGLGCVPPRLQTPRETHDSRLPHATVGRSGRISITKHRPTNAPCSRRCAWRAGENWTVVILDGKEPTFEKRGSQFGLIIQSLRPKGYNKENFAGRKALPLTPERIAELKSFVETSMKKLDVPGASLALDRRRPCRLRRRARRARVGQAGARRCRHALHGGLQYQGHDHAPARAAGGSGQTPVG